MVCMMLTRYALDSRLLCNMRRHPVAEHENTCRNLQPIHKYLPMLDLNFV